MKSNQNLDFPQFISDANGGVVERIVTAVLQDAARRVEQHGGKGVFSLKFEFTPVKGASDENAEQTMLNVKTTIEKKLPQKEGYVAEQVNKETVVYARHGNVSFLPQRDEIVITAGKHGVEVK